MLSQNDVIAGAHTTRLEGSGELPDPVAKLGVGPRGLAIDERAPMGCRSRVRGKQTGDRASRLVHPRTGYRGSIVRRAWLAIILLLACKSDPAPPPPPPPAPQAPPAPPPIVVPPPPPVDAAVALTCPPPSPRVARPATPDIPAAPRRKVEASACKSAVAEWERLADTAAKITPATDQAVNLLRAEDIHVVCDVKLLERVLAPAVTLLDDRRVVRDDSPGDGAKVYVRNASQWVLERLTGKNLGSLRVEGGFRNNVDFEKEAADDAQAVVAWRDWWRGVKNRADEIAAGRRVVEQATASREADNLRRLQTAELRAVLRVTHAPTGVVTRISDATNVLFYCWPYQDVLSLEQLAQVGHAPIPQAMLDDIRADEPVLFRRLVDRLHLEVTATDGTRAVRIGLGTPRAPDPAVAEEEAQAARVNLAPLVKAADAIIVADAGPMMLGRGDAVGTFYAWEWLAGTPEESVSVSVPLPDKSLANKRFYDAKTRDQRQIAFLRRGPKGYTLVDSTNGILPATPERIAKLKK